MRSGLILSLAMVGSVAAFGQTKPPVGYDTLYFETKVGSFKVLGAANDPCTGKLEMSFTGTILITGAEKPPIITGNVKKEYENKERKKVAYFGTGSIVLEGNFKYFQWFGTNMKGKFQGTRAVFRLYGDYDKDLQTGKVRYGYEEKDQAWFQGGRQLEVPANERMWPIVPVERGKGGN